MSGSFTEARKRQMARPQGRRCIGDPAGLCGQSGQLRGLVRQAWLSGHAGDRRRLSGRRRRRLRSANPAPASRRDRAGLQRRRPPARHQAPGNPGNTPRHRAQARHALPTDSGPDHGRDQEAESACGTTLAGARDRTLFLPHSGQPPPPPRRRAPSRRRPSAALHRFGQHQRMRPPLSTKWLQQPSVRQTEGLREATARRPAWTVQCSPSPGMRSSQIGLPQPHGQSITAWNGCSCPPTM